MTVAAELSDAELARRIAAAATQPAGDAETELCRRYDARLVAFGRSRLGCVDRARDLAQDTLLLTLRKLRAGEVREPERIGAFMLGVARTLAKSGRAHERRYAPLDDDGARLPAAPPSIPDPLARAHVRRCLEALPEKQRTVVLLTFYAEQSSGTIAAQAGLTAGNVRVLRHRGVARRGVRRARPKPRHQWHTFWNAGDTRCTLIEVIAPGGFEDYFREVAASWGDVERFAAINARYGLEMQFESVPGLCERFGLTFPSL